MRGIASLLALALSCAACLGAPSPLAPGVRGSIGVPHRGVLTGGVALPKRGEGYRLYRSNTTIRYGNPRLVAAIERAAATVQRQRPGGAPLVVGDLSAKAGGEASGHSSHRTGRDADLLVFVTTPDGRSVQAPGFVRFGPDGLGTADGDHFVRVDLEREWLLVRALVTDREATVQWLFFAHWLEALVIEYARARGEDPELVWYAESILQQPKDSAVHDDHLHLRIACTPDEAVAGCLGGGPQWSWLPAMPALAPSSDGDLTAALVGDLFPAAGGATELAEPR